jgi:tetratricopeptide (TPR) repeat protein
VALFLRNYLKYFVLSPSTKFRENIQIYTLPVHKILLYLFLSCATIVLVYYPGLSGGFVFDDISNILQPSGIAMHELSWNSLRNAALSMNYRPISLASFGLNYLYAGFDPYYFKAVNIAIHCINALLVFIVIRLLLRHLLSEDKAETNRSMFFAAAISLAWALHPVNLTNVLYIVQRMNSLSALFVLAGMLSYIKGRTSLDLAPLKGWLLMAASIFLFLPLAWHCKENGALLPLFLFILELTIFRFRGLEDRQRKGLYLFHTLFFLLPSLLALIYIFQHAGMFQAGYGNRHFSMMERLLTEPRVLWLYIRLILLPIPSAFGLFHDDIAVSVSLTEPISTLPALVGLAGLFTVAVISIKRAPILAFGLLFFLAGHLMESTFIPLELAFEHRNYLPSIGLLLPLFYYLGYAGEPGKYARIRIALMIILILLFALQTHFRAWQWSDNVRLYLTEAIYHPNSPRANYEAGKIFGQRLERGQGDPQINYSEAIRYFERATALRNNTTSGLFGSILASIDSGHEIKPEWIDELAQRLANQPLEQVNLLWLDKLTECIGKGKCRREDLQLPKLLKAAIGYQNVNIKNKSMLYAILAKYAYSVEGNRTETIKMARKSVSIMPSNMYYHLNLVKYLIWAADQVEAKKALESAAKIDIDGQHTAEISRLKKTLQME